jgi:predicted dehydrogenase
MLALCCQHRIDYAGMTIRLGLLGCGEHAEVGHAIPLARYVAGHAGAISLVAACDFRLERAELFCQKYRFARAYRSLDEMLSTEQLDACIAVVPIEHIAEIGVTLLQANMPCVVEKPLGAAVDEVKRLRDIARVTNTTNMVSVNRRFMPLLHRGIEWSRNIGCLRYVRCTMTRDARTEPDFLRTTAIHAFDTLRWIAGNVATAEVRTLKAETPSWYGIDLQFESGAHGRIDVLPTGGLLDETYELIGNGFRSVITSPFGPQRALRCYQENRLVLEQIAGNETPEDVISGFYGEVIELAQALSQKRKPNPSIEDVFPSVELCFALADQAKKGSATLVRS